MKRLLAALLFLAACAPAPKQSENLLGGEYIAVGIWTACHNGNLIYTYYQDGIFVVPGGCK